MSGRLPDLCGNRLPTTKKKSDYARLPKAHDLPEDATIEDVKRARRDLATIWHPDRLTNARLQEKGEEKLKGINDAYDWLISHEYLFGQSFADQKTQSTTQAEPSSEDIKKTDRKESYQTKSPSSSLSATSERKSLFPILIFLFAATVVVIYFSINTPGSQDKPKSTVQIKASTSSTRSQSQIYADAPIEVLYVTATVLYIRQQPSKNATILGTLPYAQLVVTKGQKDGWKRMVDPLNTSEGIGWIGGYYTNSSPPDKQDKEYVVEQSQSVNYFTIGSTKDEVVAIQGTPTSISDIVDRWNYDYSTIKFKSGRVSGYDNTSHNLKLK